jgi:molecular chaperone GrpE
MGGAQHDQSGAPVSASPEVRDSGAAGPAEDATQLSSAAPSSPETDADGGSQADPAVPTPALEEAGEVEGLVDSSDAPAAVEPEPELSEEEDAAAEAFLADLQARAGKADEYLALAQRTQADFENYRKRAVREAAIAKERGVSKVAKELLPAIDALDRALAAAKDGHLAADDPLVSGVTLVHTEVLAGLARAGIEQFSPYGEAFDPTLHEAVAQVPVDGADPGTVVEVYARGYKLGESVLRPARVVVAG